MPAPEPGAQPTLLLLDGHSLAYRAFYALPAENFKTVTGQTTNAVYGFTAMLINLLRDEKPTHVAAAFDVSRKTFRTEAFPDYKANRIATPDEFRGQVEVTQEVLGAMGIPVMAIEGYEADDVIATLTTQAVPQGFRVLIVSGDRDSLQLVNNDVTVLYPRKGVSELTRFTPEAVAEKYGLTPAQYPDFAALRGDPSDNLPGIPGVGEKTAAKWIREYGDLNALVDRVDQVKGKVGDALRANLSSVVLNRQLTEMVRDVPLPYTPDQLAKQPWDRDKIHRLFDDLEFRVLRDRLFETLAAPEPEAEGGFEISGGAVESGAVADWLTDHAKAGLRHGISVVGTGTPMDGDVKAIAIAAADGEGGYFDTIGLTPEDEQALGAWLADPATPRRCTRRRPPCTRCAGGAGAWAGCPAIRHWPRIWCVRASARSISTICRCATSRASCAWNPTRRRSCPCWTRRASSTRSWPRARCYAPARCSIWPTRSTRSCGASSRPPCSPRWSCRCWACWPSWRRRVSRSTFPSSSSCSPNSPTGWPTPRTPPTG